MVHFIWPEKKHSSTWQWTEPETTSLAGDKHPMDLEEIEEDLPLHKRWKPTSSQAANKWSLDSNEASPLGLGLKKSPSLLELIQMKLSQGNNQNKKDVKARVGTSGSIDKSKASDFPALLLRIGQWEYVSQHEGDLVAKCYFAKHKLVWEVLDGGLKSKIEIQWADIVALKPNCPENGPDTLTIVLGKQPLFFRETNPQPRKHTLWQATSDFTDGEATKYRQHYLVCAPGVLKKHYEKLIHCDTRLNFLSQKQKLDNLPFGAEAPLNQPECSVSVIKDIASGTITKDGEQAAKVQASMSVSQLVNHIGHYISEKRSSFLEKQLDNISQVLLSDTQLTNEESLVCTQTNQYGGMSRKDSFNHLVHHLPKIASLSRFLFEDG